MKLIVESGATKTSWIFIDEKKVLNTFESKGISPYFQNADEIGVEVSKICGEWQKEIKQVFYYGTGVDTELNKTIVEKSFLKILPNCYAIEVYADILAAARSACQREKGMVCILGTGSNACAYNGEKIVDNKRGFGFILGDYGSGAVLGKTLVSAFLHNELPKNLEEAWQNQGYETNHAIILKHTYKEPFPSRFLANFSKFASSNWDHPFIQNLLNQHFKEFFIHQLNPLAESRKEWPVHFIGSIAFHFQKIIKDLLKEFDFREHDFIANPAEGLVRFHLS